MGAQPSLSLSFAPSHKTKLHGYGERAVQSTVHSNAQTKRETNLDLWALAPSTQNQMSRVLESTGIGLRCFRLQFRQLTLANLSILLRLRQAIREEASIRKDLLEDRHPCGRHFCFETCKMKINAVCLTSSKTSKRGCPDPTFHPAGERIPLPDTTEAWISRLSLVPSFAVSARNNLV